MQTSLHAFNKTLQKTNEWLTQLTETASFDSKEKAYTVLCAVLHAIRDRLMVNQAVHFSAEFSLLLKGVYFDNWDPAANPSPERTKEAFLNHISLELHDAFSDIDPEKAFRSIFQFLELKISPGALIKVKSQLPAEIGALINTTS